MSPKLTHDEIVAAIQDKAARSAMVRTHYCRAAWECTGDKGLPDLVLAGPFGVAWVEVKTPASPRLSPDQTAWAWTLRAAGQRIYVVGVSELAGDLVDRLISTLALGQPGYP